jgi:hypothetical protein
MTTWRSVLGVLTTAALVGLAGTALAQGEDIPSFKKRGDMEKQFVTKVGTAVIKVARIKPQKISMLSYEYKLNTPKANRSELDLKMEFHGLVTKKRYTADIVVLLDTTDKDAWEVLNIRYSDTDPSPFGPNEKKIQELIRTMNK